MNFMLILHEFLISSSYCLSCYLFVFVCFVFTFVNSQCSCFVLSTVSVTFLMKVGRVIYINAFLWVV